MHLRGQINRTQRIWLTITLNVLIVECAIGRRYVKKVVSGTSTFLHIYFKI